MTASMQNKAELRARLLALRNAITADQRPLHDHQIAIKILEWWSVARAPTLGVYWPMRGEPDLQGIYAVLVAQGVQLALPVVVSDDAPLKFVAWTPGDPLSSDRFGSAIPAKLEPELQPQALLIPCVGFSRERFRLGYGGGFYDRTLALAPRPYSIGVAYAITETTFAADPYDIALDVVMTEEKTLP